MSGGIQHSDRSVHAWMAESLITAQSMKPARITKAPRQAGCVAATTNPLETFMNEFEQAWARKNGRSLLSRPPASEEPPALRIDLVIAVFALGVYLGSLIQ